MTSPRTRPQPIGHVFLPATMETLKRAQIGAYLSQVRLDSTAIDLSGRRTVIPADMHPDMSWDILAPLPKKIVATLVGAGAIVRTV